MALRRKYAGLNGDRQRDGIAHDDAQDDGHHDRADRALREPHPGHADEFRQILTGECDNEREQQSG